MRRRYQLNLHTESDLESDLADYIERFPQGSRRSEEIRRLCLIGYQIMIKGKTDDEAVMHSYDPGLQKVISNYVRDERERSLSSNNQSIQMSDILSLIKKEEKSKEEIALEYLISLKDSNNKGGALDVILDALNSKPDLSGNQGSFSEIKKDEKKNIVKEEVVENQPLSNDIKSPENKEAQVSEITSTDIESEEEKDLIEHKKNIEEDQIWSDAEDIDIEEQSDKILDPLSRLGF